MYQFDFTPKHKYQSLYNLSAVGILFRSILKRLNN